MLGTNVLVVDNELGRYVGLPELHNEGSEQQMSPRDRPNSTQSPGRHADCFFSPLLCSNAATHKRVKDIQEQQQHTHTHTTDVVRHNREQRNLLRVMKIKRLHVLLCQLFFSSFVSNKVHYIHLKEEGSV